MDKNKGYKYKLWAWTYYPYPILKKEWTKTIYRKNKLTAEQKESLSGHFADKLAWKHNKNILLYGCAEVEDK